uniref:Endoribonuclease ZC3H12A-like n=1 Tax=Petromyzon marinus TaxID=7757 RepID=A0AAJ7UD63_PETMA|nr:endoribonuclease ZC3H12A-like [Petromyzon marinus]XP_032832609.1 endoribonuclease ZC3H12A-like [Petromyzon marinus]
MPSEFVVREDAAALVARHRLHVRQCYGVAVDLDDAAPVGGSRWVRLSGGDGSQRQRAKDYIVALCSPDSAAAAAGDRRDDAAAAAAGDAGRTTAGEEEAGGAAPPGYESSYQLCLDFARKLGYSESQVRDAIGRLGGAPLHNTLLEELLKHGAAAPAPAEGAAAGGKARGAAASSAYDEGQERLSRVLVARGGGEPEPPADPTPPFDPDDSSNLRHIVIDGSNVAMSHGNKEVFSCRGIELAVSWFLQRGHKEVTVLVPTWRREQPRADAPITDQHILTELERRRVLVFTPSRRVQGRRVVCYDDRFIVRLAHESDGVIVSNDNYRDLQSERAEWRRFVEERLLMYSFVNDKFMLPDDPLGRDGPTLENFLRKVPVPTQNKRVPCPYGRKCTFGNKCKYSHPERANQIQLSVADELRAAAGQQQQQLQQEVAGAAEGTSEGRGAPAGSPSRATARPHRKDAAPAEVQHQSGKPPAKPFPGHHHHHQHQLPPTPTKAQQLQPSQLAVPQLQNQPAHGYHHHHQQQQQQQLQQQQQQQLQQQQTRTGTAAPVGAWGVLDWSEGGEECSQQDSGYNSLRTLSGASQDGAAMLPSVATGGGGGGGGGGVAGVVYGAGCYSDPGIASDPSSGQYRQAQYYQHDAYAVQGPSKLPPHHPSHPPHPSRQQHHANRQQHLHPNQHHQQQQQHLHQHPHHGSHGAPFNPATAADGQLAATFPGGCGAYRPDLPYGAPCSCCVRFPAQKQQQQVQQVQQQQQLAPGPFISDSFLYDSGSSVPLPQPNSWHGPLGQPAAAYRSLYQQHPSHPPAHHHHHQQQQQQQQPYHNHQQQQQQRYQPRHYPPIAQPAPFQNAAVGAGGGGAGGGDDGVTEQLRAQVFRNLCGVFPQPVVDRVMAMHPHVTDSQELATYCVKMKALPPPPPAAAPMQPPRSY